MASFTLECVCNCKCWGDCYSPDFVTDKDICTECSCHDENTVEAEEFFNSLREQYEDEKWGT